MKKFEIGKEYLYIEHGQKSTPAYINNKWDYEAISQRDEVCRFIVLERNEDKKTVTVAEYGYNCYQHKMEYQKPRKYEIRDTPNNYEFITTWDCRIITAEDVDD